MTASSASLDKRILLSTLWIFVMFNYLYADVMGLMDASLLRQFFAGEVGGMKITSSFLFAAAVLMEIPIAMVLLARILPYGPNRVANLVAAAIKTLAVLGSLFVGKPTSYYLFFSTIEVATTIAIAVLAWRWKVPKVAASEKG